MTDTKPTREELIEWLNKPHGVGNSLPDSYKEAILKELAAIKSQPVPVEPMSEMWLAGNRLPQGLKLYPQKAIDSLQSALKVAQQERDTEKERADRASRMAQGNYELYKRTVVEANEAEAEVASLRLELAQLNGEIPYGN